MSDEAFAVVWNPGAGAPTVKHRNLDEAREEAKRLARQNVGQQFFVLVAVDVAHVPVPDVMRRLKPPIGFDEIIPF